MAYTKPFFIILLCPLMLVSWERPYFFIQMADPQIPWNTGGYISEELFPIAVAHANRLQPEFVIICGDLLNINGNAFDVDEANDFFQRFKVIADGFEVPVHNVAGNHDVINTPIPASLEWYTQNFGELWYSFEHMNNLFIVLESDVIKNPEGAPGTDDEQIAWLTEELETAKALGYYSIMTFMHHPMAYGTVNEPEEYFNLPVDRRQELIGLYKENGVIANFSGHYHRNAYVQDGDLELITTSSTGVQLGSQDPGFRIVKINGAEMQQEYYAYEELPEFVEADNPSLTVTSPNGGELIESTITHTITWNSQSMAPHLKIEYQTGDDNWKSIIDSTPNSGSFDWTVPIDHSKTVKLRLTTLTSDVTDESDDFFEITGQGLSVHHKSITPVSISFLLFDKRVNFSCLCSEIKEITLSDIHGNSIKNFIAGRDELAWRGLDSSGQIVTGGIYILSVRGPENFKSYLIPGF